MINLGLEPVYVSPSHNSIRQDYRFLQAHLNIYRTNAWKYFTTQKQFNNANLVMLIAMVLKTEARRCLVCHSLTVQYENSLEVPQSRGHDVSFSNLADLIVHFCYPFLVTSWHFPSAFARTVLHAIKIKTSSIYIDRQFLVFRFWIFSKLVSLLQFLSQHQVRSESDLVTN